MTLNHLARRKRRVPRSNLARQRVSSEGRDLLICDYLEALDCPRALTSWLLYKYGEHRQLVMLQCDPSQHENALGFRAAYAATKFLSKCVGLKTGIDLKGVALKSAEEAEHKCRSTNEVIEGIRDGRVSDLWGAVWYHAAETISRILGAIPSSFEDVGWSTGRTSSAYGTSVTGYHKYQSSPDVTVRSRARALQLLRESPWWGASILQVDAPVSVLPSTLRTVGGNTLITVPKSAKTDRTICYEPHMNIRLQLAVGGYIRRRLRKHGINLDDQSINRRRARLGSKHGGLATIDLSSASDTVSLELVYELLPIDWACLLDDLRSGYTLWPDGSNRKNEKFSSMGNGFTFELESLIFFALANAITANVSVYGDDIIVPSESFSRVASVLRAAGFSLNDAKSFGSGQFRESCGGDYFGGVLCTPVYLRSLPKTVEDVMKLHNAVRRFATVHPERKWQKLMAKWRTIYPGHLGPQGPEVNPRRKSNDSVDPESPQYGDGHYHVNWDECSPRAALDWDPDTKKFGEYTGLAGWVYRTRVPYMVADDALDRYAPAVCVGTGPKRAFNLLQSANRRLMKYKNIWGLAMEWPDILWI